MDFLKQWVVGVVTFVALDFVWLGLVANGFYRRELGPLLRMNGDRLDPRLVPAILLYTMLVAGLIVFALPRARPGSMLDAALWSAAFGVIGYGVYDLTNYSTLQAFPLRVTAVDMAWGGVICAVTGAVVSMVRPA
jgi:uncharacterized membrane protein